MSSIRKHVVELDVLRWIAAVFMIVNHGGYRLLEPADATSGLTGTLVFIGSFAPVLFFFATGFGVALSMNATGRAPALGSTFAKSMLLVAADQLLFWRSGSPGGVNFLGFIGLSSLVVSVIARFRRAVPICIAIMAGLVLLRYGIGPRLFQSPADPGWLGWLVGVHHHDDMPYPPSPWLIYPLLGFVLGRAYAWVRLDQSEPRNRWYLAAIVSGASFLAGAGVLFAMGAIFFRWGTVSAAYFVLSLAVLSWVGLTSMALAAVAPRVATHLSLQGVASFAVIPIHYGFLELVATSTSAPVSRPAYLALIMLTIAICLWLSNRFSEQVAGWVSHVSPTVMAAVLAGLLVLAIAVVLSSAVSLPVAAWGGMVAGQLAVAGLLAVRRRRRSPS